jgi:hypothetical protein
MNWHTHETSPQPPAEVAAPAASPNTPPVGWYDHPTSNPVTTAAAEAATPAEPTKTGAAWHDANAAKEAADAVPIHLPESVKTLRDGDSKMHDPTAHYTTAIAEDDIVDGEEMAPEVKTAVVNELRRMMADTGVSGVEAREVTNLAKSIRDNPPTDENEQQWREESMKLAMDMANGDAAQAQRDVDLARALVARDPRLGKILDATHLSNHPRVYALVLQQARSERARGRL